MLLLQSGALGDCALQLRMAEAMRLALPAAHITWFGRNDWLAIAQRCVPVDETVGLDTLRAHRLFAPGTRTDADLSDLIGRFDLVVNGLAGPDSPVMERLRRFARRTAVCYDTKAQSGLADHICRQWLGQIAAQVAAVLPALAADIERYAGGLEHQPSAFLVPGRRRACGGSREAGGGRRGVRLNRGAG